MRTVIIGAGEVGINAARMLSEVGHSVVLIEQDEKLVERASEQLDALVIHGNGASPKLLAEAGIDKADLLVAASSSDEANIIACLAAKTKGIARTVARVHNPDYYDPQEPFAEEMLGLDYVIHTEQMAAEEIKEALLVPGAINVETFAEDSIEVAEVILNEGSPAVGQAFPEGAIVAALLRNGDVIIPTGKDVLEPGDDAVVFTVEDAVEEVERLFAP